MKKKITHLAQDPNWKAVHFGSRVILRSDECHYSKEGWLSLLNEITVRPLLEAEGHYREV